MFKDMSRAKRRHHRTRLKKNRRYYWGFGKFGWRGYCQDEIVEMTGRQAGMVVNTPTPCSCLMCCNPRHNGWETKKECLTIQERKASENYNYNMEEIDGC